VAAARVMEMVPDRSFLLLRRLFFLVNSLALAVVIGSLPEAGRVSSDGSRNHSGGRSKSRTNYTRSKFRTTATSNCGSYKKAKGALGSSFLHVHVFFIS
jgi:hypothetical protein